MNFQKAFPKNFQQESPMAVGSKSLKLRLAAAPIADRKNEKNLLEKCALERKKFRHPQQNDPVLQGDRANFETFLDYQTKSILAIFNIKLQFKSILKHMWVQFLTNKGFVAHVVDNNFLQNFEIAFLGIS